MPFGGGRTLAVNVSGLIWDANLVVPAGNIITVDHIAQTTGGHGTVMDSTLHTAGLLSVDANGEVTGGGWFTVDHVGENTGGHGVSTGNVFRVDHISEATPAHNIVLDNTETGRQGGTGNSATGAVPVFSVSSLAPNVGGIICAVRIRRAGTYKVKVYNSAAFVGGGHVHIYTNDGSVDETAANNVAGTDEDLGDQVYAAGDLFYAQTSVAVPALQNIMVTFLNADGMWE